MTKFDSLCAAYAASRKKFFTVRDDAFGFGQEMVVRYRKFLGVPDENFQVVPTKETPDPAKTYLVPGVMHLNDDGFWHLGLNLTVQTAPGAIPKQRILIVFHFKRTDEIKYLVKIYENDKGHHITLGSDAEFETFFEFIQGKIVDDFEHGLERFMDQASSPRRIGFRS